MPPDSQAEITRRAMLAASGTFAAALFVGGKTAAAGFKAEVNQPVVISSQPELYNGWPTLTRCKDGELLLVCSGGRESHVCPFGQVHLLRSRDDGKTWSWPQVILDSALDDRDAGVLETNRGTLLVTTFTSLAYEAILAKAEPEKWAPGRLERWRGARDRINAERRQQDLGVWMIRSTDRGLTWSAKYDCLVNSPHGPIQLADGRQLYAGKQLWQPGEKNIVCESRDDGATWQRLGAIPTRPGDKAEHYHELHAVEVADGKLMVHIRNHNVANPDETLQCESSDGGKTWTVPHPIGVWGLPSHLLRLRDGRLLMSYGYRRPRYGIQARFSADAGQTWSEQIRIAVDGIGFDLGYPSTVELADGTFLTVWYERMVDNPRAVLRQATWRLLDT